MPGEISFIWLIVSLVIVGSYALLLLVFFIVLISTDKNGSNLKPLNISVIIPFKNECEILERRIENAECLVKCLQVSEVIFINDHSTDLTTDQLNEIFKNTTSKLLHLPTNIIGKKAAIHFGINHAIGSWILTSDADTTIDPTLFESLKRDIEPNISCFILPVRPAVNMRIVRILFDLEFLVLQAVGIASAKIHMPLLANGAALFFRRDSYFKAASQRADWNIPGGDDLFTIFSIAQNEGRRAVTAHKSPRPSAEAEFPQTLKLLWNQRLRWIQKVPGTGGFWFRGVAWLVLLANLVLAASWLLTGLTDFNGLVGYVTMLKTLPEFFILAWAVLYFQRRETILWIVPGILIYPFYLVSLILSGIFIKSVWK